MKSIYGAIGYTVLRKNSNKVIIMADMHDTLSECDSDISISEWVKSKFSSSQILLEEVPRGNIELQELWSHAPHTRELKNLFLTNPRIINAVDIRPFLIPFSWEIVEETEDKNILLVDYLYKLDQFFSVTEPYFLTKLPNYRIANLKNTNLGEHFLKIKQNFRSYCITNQHLFDNSIIDLYYNNLKVLVSINDILSDVMEWYICALINLYKGKPIILHTGLAHSEKVIEWLTQYYGYDILTTRGINKMKDLSYESLNGCMVLSNEIDSHFGGSGFFA